MSGTEFQNDLLGEIADRLKAMGNPTRLMIICAVKEEGRSVSDIAELLDMEIGTVSHHLKALERVGLLSGQRHGRQVIYSISAPLVLEVCQALCRQVESDLQQSEKQRDAFVALRAKLGG